MKPKSYYLDCFRRETGDRIKLDLGSSTLNVAKTTTTFLADNIIWTIIELDDCEGHVVAQGGGI